jgi:hypothetical protein
VKPRKTLPKTESDEQLLKIKDILSRVHTRSTIRRPTTSQIVEPSPKSCVNSAPSVGRNENGSFGFVSAQTEGGPGSAATAALCTIRRKHGAILLPACQRGVTTWWPPKDGTDKTVAARKFRGCAVVKPSWLMDCFGLSDVNPKRGISWGRSVLTRTLALWWTPRRKIPHPVAVMKTTTTTGSRI